MLIDSIKKNIHQKNWLLEIQLSLLFMQYYLTVS